jgi:hypothetical protein
VTLFLLALVLDFTIVVTARDDHRLATSAPAATAATCETARVSMMVVAVVCLGRRSLSGTRDGRVRRERC